MKTSKSSVELIDFMGSDLSVVNAARVSFHKEGQWENRDDQFVDVYLPDETGKEYGKTIERPGFVGQLSEGDQKLINYLAKHKHWTPFAHAFLSFRIKTSFAMARQLVKHQVGLVWNEVSRRYVSDDMEYYIPDIWRGKPINAKQGSSDVTLGFLGDSEKTIYEEVTDLYEAADRLYNRMIAGGVAPEQARFVVPLAGMTEWIWSGSLAAFARVCKLRLDPHAQLEVSEVASSMNDLIPVEFQYSWKALMEN